MSWLCEDFAKHDGSSGTPFSSPRSTHLQRDRDVQLTNTSKRMNPSSLLLSMCAVCLCSSAHLSSSSALLRCLFNSDSHDILSACNLQECMKTINMQTRSYNEFDFHCNVLENYLLMSSWMRAVFMLTTGSLHTQREKCSKLECASGSKD